MIFDQYQRYKTVEVITDIIKEKINRQKLTILEIGANEECNLEKVLPNEEIQYSDIYLTEKMRADKRFIQVNGCNMPEIANGQYDLVIALDVLEHVPEEQRKAFMNEVSRVAKYVAIVCFPYKTAYNENAEERINSYYKMLYGEDHKWLIEHIQNGLPEIDEIISMLMEDGISFKEFYHGDIFLWEEMMKALFTVYGLWNAGYYFEQIDKLYEEYVYFNDNSDFSYRVFTMLSNDERLLQGISDRLGEKYTGRHPEKIKGLICRCIDDLKYRFINEQGRKISIQHQIYYSYGEGFNEDNKLILSSDSLDAERIHIDKTIKIDSKYKALRFDPVEEENCILKKLKIESNDGIIDYKVVNGMWDNDRIVFCEEDPQIYIDLTDKRGIQWIRITADMLRTKFPEAVIRYPFNKKIDISLEQLLECINGNAKGLDEIKGMGMEYAQKQNIFIEYMRRQDEINQKLNKCNELLDIKVRQCEELQLSLSEVLEREKQIILEKEKWEKRCSQMEQTISWRATGILRKLGKLLGV